MTRPHFMTTKDFIAMDEKIANKICPRRDPKMTANTFELSITLKGTNKSALRRKLMEIIAEFDDDYGKPRQGIYGEFDVESKISTPIWDGKEY